jgi:uncharacterized protein (DUF1501 family)
MTEIPHNQLKLKNIEPPRQVTEMRATRRRAMLGLAASAFTARASLAVAQAPTQRRFVVVLLRGALDGLAAVVPYGDPALAGLRAPLIGKAVGEEGGQRDLGGFFGLHPALAELHAMYAANELLILHAIAGQYRTRSHFDGQDYLESGAGQRLSSGWLNRALAAMPGPRGQADALAVGVSLPLLLRGPAHASSWAPSGFAAPAPEFYARVLELHGADPVTGPALTLGLHERGIASAALAGAEPEPNRASFHALATAAGRMLRAPGGPRIAALELDGWDTHKAQNDRLPGVLRQLDTGLAALKAALGDVWRSTCVLVMTEFGRTVRVNGTGGTDHGTASVAFLAGGAVAGGRVRADWPGLGAGRLLDNRDLMPTADLRVLAMSVLTQHLGIPATATGRIFPGGDSLASMPGLVKPA